MSSFMKIAEECVNKKRIERMKLVLEDRTCYIAPVFENLNKPHNANAVIRTCDAFGINKIHFIEENSKFGFNPDIAQGSHKWVESIKYNDKKDAINNLKDQGYKLVSTNFSETSISPEEIPLDNPLAIVFGNEKVGISDYTLNKCDYHVKIPMYGFVDSFNVSVAAALIFSSLIRRLRNEKNLDWKLNEKEKKKVFRKWLFYNTNVGVIVSNKRKKSNN